MAKKKYKEIAASPSAPRNDENKLFPKINRFITEEWKLILSSLMSGVIIFGIVFQGIELYKTTKMQDEITQQRIEVIKERNFWEDQLVRYPNHRDIYFKIATLEYSLGNKNEARMNLDKALEIDPNFEEGRELEQQLGL